MAESEAGVNSAEPRVHLGYLLLTAVTCGAMIMVVEVLGSRVVGPFYGVSLFVWTSLITVAMIALAAGYAIGGVLADRKGTPDTLYGIILGAGVLVLIIPFIKAPVLKACLPLGLRAGSLTSALILFGPSLFLLGCVSPFLVKIATRELKSLGRTVGNFYALSTVGSVLGTVATGFYLIALLGVDQIFQLVGGLLIALALGYFVLLRRRWAALGFLLVPPLLAPPAPRTEAVLDNGTAVTRMVAIDSHYGSLKVLDYSKGRAHIRELVIDGLIQGGIDVKTGLSTHPYPYFLQFLPYAIHPDGKSCLVVGLGAGVIPRWYEAKGIRTDVVDIDDNVAALAETWFGFEITGEIFIEDARYFLANTDRTYDYVILDVYTGDTTPSHLMSAEALALLADRLEPGGVVGINLVGSTRKETFMTASAIATLETIFDQVEVHPAFDPRQGGTGNLEVVAYQGPKREADFDFVAAEPIHNLAGPALIHELLDVTFHFPDGTPFMVLTDAYNPIDVYDAWLREEVRRTVIDGTDADILIGSG